jgi:Uma2 family endonuclease
MNTVATPLTCWEEFLLLPDGPNGQRYELRDGEETAVPLPSPVHVYSEVILVKLLTDLAKGQGRAAQEFPYRPAKNLQFWYADVAYVPGNDWKAMRNEEYPVYSPPLIVEILSPSNKPEEINRKRVAAFSCGTREFWLVDPKAQTIEVSMPGSTNRVYKPGEQVPISVLPEAFLPVSKLFDEAID